MDDKNSDLQSENEVLEIISNPSLNEYLKNENDCDYDSIFDEISKLSSLNEVRFHHQDDDRSIEDILREAQALISQPLVVSSKLNTISSESTPLEIKNNILDQYDYSTATLHDVSNSFLLSLLR
jgi:arsenate reductase-like glutaredoxin family protein